MVPFAYNARGLWVRKTTTFATAGGIGLVVFVFCSALMLSEGLKRTLTKSGSDDVAIVLRDGSDAELSSGLETPNIAVIASQSEVRRRSDGVPDAVGEVLGVLALDKLGANGISNAQIRGVTDDVFLFRPTAHITKGRKLRPGTEEAVVGSAISGRFRGLNINEKFEIRKNRWVTVVGIFEDGGSSFESEIWADIDVVRSAFGREALVSSVRARFRSRSAFDSYKRALESDPKLDVDVVRETEYYEKQSEGTSTFIGMMGVVVAVFFSIGAMIGAMITMYAGVANRIREIGTLRALGFSKGSILISFLLESVMLSLAGGALGVLAAMAMGFVRFSVVNMASWSEIVFAFEPTPPILIGGVLFAGVMGLLGGIFPAVRAARIGVLEALRA